MARIRSIKPDFWEDEKLGRLEDLDRLNFLGLISLADDEGRGRGATEWLCNRLHPYSVNGHALIMEESLKRLADINVVRFYEVDGQRFYQLRNFNRHQKINRPTPSRLPSFNDASHTTHGDVTEPSPREGIRRERSGEDRSGADQITKNGAAALSATATRAARGVEETEALKTRARIILGTASKEGTEV